MNKAQVNTITRKLNERANEIVNAKVPALTESTDADAAVLRALVNGTPVKLRSTTAIRQSVLDKLTADRYSDRGLSLAQVFESSPEIAAAKKRAAERAAAAARFRTRLGAVVARIVSKCELGQYDVDPAVALDEFESLAGKVAA